MRGACTLLKGAQFCTPQEGTEKSPCGFSRLRGKIVPKSFPGLFVRLLTVSTGAKNSEGIGSTAIGHHLMLYTIGLQLPGQGGKLIHGDNFICGPVPMMENMRKTLIQLGYRKGQIHWEGFSL